VGLWAHDEITVAMKLFFFFFFLVCYDYAVKTKLEQIYCDKISKKQRKQRDFADIGERVY